MEDRIVRLPRMTTRRWMVAVVIMGCVMGGIQIERRREELVDRADWYRIFVYIWEERRAAEPNDADAPRFIAYFESLETKYQQAARSPWLPVEPDPPPPEP